MRKALFVDMCHDNTQKFGVRSGEYMSLDSGFVSGVRATNELCTTRYVANHGSTQWGGCYSNPDG